MFKCMHRWTDPTHGKSESAVGPYSCGRKAGHRGVHAWDGNGAAALWTDSGELRFSVQVLQDREPGWLGKLIEGDEETEPAEAAPPDPDPERNRRAARAAARRLRGERRR
jgi:hypothetical protein